MDPHQQFRLGSTIELLAVRRDNKRDYYYNRLSDIRHYFPSAWGFKVNGINILFLEDENEECFEPKRIAHYPDTIIDIVTANNTQEQEEPQQQEKLPSTPASFIDDIIVPPQDIVTADLDKNTNEQQPASPLSSKEDIDQSVPALSVQPNSAVTTRPRRATFGASSPPASLPAALVTRSSPIGTDALQDHQHQQQQQEHQPITSVLFDSPAPQFSTAPVREHTHKSTTPNLDKVIQQLADTQFLSSAERSRETDDNRNHAIDQQEQQLHQQQKLEQLTLAQKRLDAAFTLNEELHEYPIPRLFALLPSSFMSKHPSGTPLQNFRLYFLCECGERCDSNNNNSNYYSTNMDAGGPSSHQQRTTNTMATTELSGSRPRATVHLVKHDGYELSRTAEFIEKYGTYVLGMLSILKHSLALSTLTCPGLGVFHERVDPSSKAAENMISNTITTINMTIDSLEKTLGLSNDSDAATTTDRTDMDPNEAGETFKYLRALDGAEHRRLDTFLSSINHDGFLGDLYRITTEAGFIKWVCFEHYRTLYTTTAMSSFVDSVEANGGAYSPYLSKAVVNLTSSSAAKDFFSKLASQALALAELDIALDWKFGSSDLAALASAIAQSNLRILRLDMRDDKGKKSAFEGISLGKGRYHPLLQMVSSKKLRGVFFSNVHHLGSRVSGLPQNQAISTLERFHLLNVIEPSDQVRLANILTSCPGLVDLRIGSFSSQRKMHPTLYLAIASLKMLKNLHIYSMDTGLPTTNLLGDSIKWEDVPLSTDALKGLVSTGCVMNRAKLESLIQASSGILEVLVLEFTEKQREIVELAPAQYREHASSSQQQQRHSLTALSRSVRPFSKLTHLHLSTGITDASIELLASVVWNLSLVHFGADEQSKRLLKYVNFASLKSLSLMDLAEDDLHPLYEAFLDEKRPCQLKRMDLKIVGPLRTTLTDLLHAIPLKRLELVAFERKSLLKILPVVNLTRLEVLSIQPRMGSEAATTTTTTMKVQSDPLSWDCEAALAGRIDEVTEHFLVQCEFEGVTPNPPLPGSPPRTAEGSRSTLPVHRIAFLKRPEMEHQHWQSILSTVF
ncbi:hypothetical protein BGX24_008935 [Mortierella sp. AD032]|nr:hypothetical protein BGX24_008935 [Mortierella sp. AD032]